MYVSPKYEIRPKSRAKSGEIPSTKSPEIPEIPVVDRKIFLPFYRNKCYGVLAGHKACAWTRGRVRLGDTRAVREATWTDSSAEEANINRKSLKSSDSRKKTAFGFCCNRL
jgi:hypothetical protein